jgi:hypothetical protein
LLTHIAEQQAVTDALKLLGKYMANPTPQAADVVVKLRKSRDGEWIWAEFEPANWLDVVQPGSEVGLFEKQLSKSLAPTPLFWRGPMYLVFGKMKGGLTTWTELNSHAFSIDRPVNYAVSICVRTESIFNLKQDAVEATKNCLRNCTLRWNFGEAEKRGQQSHRDPTEIINLIAILLLSRRSWKDSHLLFIQDQWPMVPVSIYYQDR